MEQDIQNMSDDFIAYLKRYRTTLLHFFEIGREEVVTYRLKKTNNNNMLVETSYSNISIMSRVSREKMMSEITNLNQIIQSYEKFKKNEVS